MIAPQHRSWQFRFESLQKAHRQLAKGIAISDPSDIEQQGIIQAFEFTFELCWKTLKDYLVSEGFSDLNSPRQVLKQAAQSGLLRAPELWLDILDKRNLLSHTYDQALADMALELIRHHYAAEVDDLVTGLEAKGSARD